MRNAHFTPALIDRCPSVPRHPDREEALRRSSPPSSISSLILSRSLFAVILAVSLSREPFCFAACFSKCRGIRYQVPQANDARAFIYISFESGRPVITAAARIASPLPLRWHVSLFSYSLLADPVRRPAGHLSSSPELASVRKLFSAKRSRFFRSTNLPPQDCELFIHPDSDAVKSISFDTNRHARLRAQFIMSRQARCKLFACFYSCRAFPAKASDQLLLDARYLQLHPHVTSLYQSFF